MTAGASGTPGDVTYRELVDAAFSAVGRASFEMMRTRFIDATQASAAVDAYRDLLDAVRTHLEYFLPAVRNVAPNAADLDITDRSGFVAPLTTGVALLGARARRTAAPIESARASQPATAWREAAGHLRGARELLDTHRDADLGWRTPDAWLLDSRRPQAAAVTSIADLVRTIANAGQALAIRAREASRDLDCADLLNPAPLRIAAASLCHPASGERPIAALDELTVARTTTTRERNGWPVGRARPLRDRSLNTQRVPKQRPSGAPTEHPGCGCTPTSGQ